MEASGDGDGRDWDVRVDALGQTVAMHVASQDLREEVLSHWSHCLADAGQSPDYELSSADVETLIGSGDRRQSGLTAHITDLGIRRGRGAYLMLHAAGLEDDQERALALVGASGVGKSTAVATLGPAGWGYITDEVVAVEPDGTIRAFPRPLVVRDRDRSHGPKVQRSPDDLGLRRCSPRPRMRALVLLDRTDGIPAELAPVPLMDAVLELIPQTSFFTSLARPLHRLLGLVDSCGGVWRLRYSEIGEVDGLLRNLLSQPPLGTREWTDPGRRPEPEGSVAWGLMDGRVRRGAYSDAVEIHGELLVLADRNPCRLNGIGVTMWLLAADAPTPEQLTEAVIAEHGPHPDAEAIVLASLQQLCDAKVLAYSPPRPLVDADARPDLDLLPKPPQPPPDDR